MTTRLVAILGLGNPNKPGPGYDPVEYTFEGRTATRSPLVSRAITELLAPVDTVVYLGTKDVREKRVETGAVAEALGRPCHFVEIPKGEDDEKRWDLFKALRRALDLTPLAEAGERTAPTRILFDVTHGFRTQPLFAMSVLSYMQSEWARCGDRAPELRVLYGAYDPQQQTIDTPAPLWDLTLQLTVTRWNAALDALMRYGRADDLEALAADTSAAQNAAARGTGVTGSALATTGIAKRFGALARAFADDVALARFASLLTGVRDPRRPDAPTRGTATKLREFLQSADTARLTAQIPVLRDSIGRLAAWLEPLQAARIESPEGAAALAAFARFGVRVQRYAEAVAAAREGLVTLHALGRGGAVTKEPGLAGYHAERRAAEGAVARDGSGAVAKAFGRVTQPRNDVLHGGLNDQPLDAGSLRAQIRHLAGEFGALAQEPVEVLAVARGSFVNLSNHPVATWSDAQRDAAAALGFGDACDLAGGMPHVPPGDEAEAVWALAREVAAHAVAQGARAAMVSTDFTLTHALVMTLEAQGVRCFAATTTREVVERVRDDGATEKTAVFRFVRWRAYRA